MNKGSIVEAVSNDRDRWLSCRCAICGSHGMKSNEQGEYCRGGSATIVIAIRSFH